MANYVKFLRGTPQAYANLAPNYNSDTLYFICEPDSDDGVLYLGSKLISGGEINDFSIGDLKDIIVDNVGDKQILVYDDGVGAWVNINYEELIENFVGATDKSSGLAGLVPAPARGETNLFLRSDGTWAEINVSASGDNTIFSVENDKKSAHAALIEEATAQADLIVGDIFIVKDIIKDNKYQHTAYVYNGSAWSAMDGNYNAENVYFSDDFIFTENIGTVEIPSSGSTSVNAAGLNLKQFFASIFAEEKDPEVTAPSVSIALSPNTTSYEVGSTCSPKYKITFDAGTYTYGPETGVTATYAVEDTNNNTSTEMIDTFPEITITDNTQYRIGVIATHSDGEIPLTNIGNECADKQILGDSLDKVYTSYIKGYRNGFYGTLSNKNELTSDIIRSLSKTGKAVTANSTMSISIPVGAMRIVFAYPSTIRDVSSVKDVNGMNAEIATSFVQSTLQVKGNNDYDAIDYKVYVLDYAEGATETNTYKVTI